MKTPRVQDFDPHAKVPELGSSMENFPTIQKPQAKPGASFQPPLTGATIIHQSTPHVQNEVRPVQSVPPVRPVHRVKIRHPFDLYQDQIETLRQLALDERKRGEQGSMSAMVREALDTYIAKKQQGE